MITSSKSHKATMIFPDKVENANTLTAVYGKQGHWEQYIVDEPTYLEIKKPHGYSPGSIKETDAISAIDASIDYQHIVIGEKKPNKALRETLENNEIPEGVSFLDAYNKTVLENAQTITTRVDASSNSYIAIKNATKKGYLEAEEGDGIDISQRMEYHRGTVQKGLSQTLSTQGGGEPRSDS